MEKKEKIEQRVKDMQNTVGWCDIYIIGVPERGEKENETKVMYREMMAEIFSETGVNFQTNRFQMCQEL